MVIFFGGGGGGGNGQLSSFGTGIFLKCLVVYEKLQFKYWYQNMYDTSVMICFVY